MGVRVRCAVVRVISDEVRWRRKTLVLARTFAPSVGAPSN